ncbi:prominin-1-A isoform X1 [Aplysia californica]|uniref:Prominin-1-A isoform X1 n=1 Tax=Aplysia californica TaxID=6500 RepID=A0ABM1VT24_APLCA|nr:prominin-1-A isoform X1 [Aplysia californica]
MAVFVSTLLFVLCLSSLCVGAGGEDVDKDGQINRNEMGMAVLYDMVHVFLGDVLQKEKITDSFLNLSTVFVDGDFDSESLEEWQDWADYLKGFAVCVALGLVYLVFMPLVGLIFCCCRMCGKCGARRKTKESKRGKCKRRSYCTVLLILNTVTLAGVVCAFVCNSLIYKHLQNDDDKGVLGHIKSGLGSFSTFMNDSVQEASNYIITEYDGTSTDVLAQVNGSADAAVEGVLNQLNATAYIDEAKSVAREANKTKDALDEVAQNLAGLKDESDELKNNLTDIKNDISAICGTSGCSGFDANDYNTDANFSSLGELQSQAAKVAQALDMNRYILQAEAAMADAKDQARAQVVTQTDDAAKAVKDVRVTIVDKLAELEKFKDDALNFLPETYRNLDDANEDAREYSKYVFYGGIGICCAYLLIVVLYYVGIIYGLCGERPGHDAPCCHTGVGANFLMAGVGFTFIFSWLLMLLCLILFATGGPAYTEVCRYFVDHNPEDVRFLDEPLKNGFDFRSWYDKFPEDFSVSGTLQMCQNNASLYTAMHLDNVVNLDEMLNLQELDDKLDELKRTTVNVDNITILSQDLKDDLQKFADSGLDSVNFAEYFVELNSLNKQLTKTELSTLASTVEAFANNFPSPDKETLLNSAARLRTLDSQTIPAMKNRVDTLNSSLIELQATSTLKSSVLKLITDLEGAQTDFNSNKDDLIKNEITKLADSIIATTNSSVKRVKEQVRTNLVKCEPLVAAVYTLTDSACVLGLDPVNGLWFSFGWCLFFFIPCLIFAVLLASQYRREQEYEKDFDDPNYPMYGGHSSDTYPLTSVEEPRSRHSRGSYPSSSYPAPQQSGQTNSAYSPESKGYGPQHAPPPYDEHRHHPDAWTGDNSTLPARRSFVGRNNKVQPI